MRDTDKLLADAFAAMKEEGVAMGDIGPLEARSTTLLHRARNERKAESMLPLLGPDIAAQRIGCCPRTVYNLAKRASRKKMQKKPQACA